jgi:hypothetical protein
VYRDGTNCGSRIDFDSLCFYFVGTNDFTGAWSEAPFNTAHMLCPGTDETDPYVGKSASSINAVFRYQDSGDFVTYVEGMDNDFCVDVPGLLNDQSYRDISVDFCTNGCSISQCITDTGLLSGPDGVYNSCDGDAEGTCGDGGSICDDPAFAAQPDCYLGSVRIHASCEIPLVADSQIGPLNLFGGCGGNCPDGEDTVALCEDFEVDLYGDDRK